ncbi:MAG: hypothetical protein J0L92_03720 [Deltaproteobacteria bacterium]|nr:hypothetical protein [Deltaproteobacteria bacterium]
MIEFLESIGLSGALLYITGLLIAFVAAAVGYFWDIGGEATIRQWASGYYADKRAGAVSRLRSALSATRHREPTTEDVDRFVVGIDEWRNATVGVDSAVNAYWFFLGSAKFGAAFLAIGVIVGLIGSNVGSAETIFWNRFVFVGADVAFALAFMRLYGWLQLSDRIGRPRRAATDTPVASSGNVPPNRAAHDPPEQGSPHDPAQHGASTPQPLVTKDSPSTGNPVAPPAPDPPSGSVPVAVEAARQPADSTNPKPAPTTDENDAARTFYLARMEDVAARLRLQKWDKITTMCSRDRVPASFLLEARACGIDLQSTEPHGRHPRLDSALRKLGQSTVAFLDAFADGAHKEGDYLVPIPIPNRQLPSGGRAARVQRMWKRRHSALLHNMTVDLNHFLEAARADVHALFMAETKVFALHHYDPSSGTITVLETKEYVTVPPNPS